MKKIIICEDDSILRQQYVRSINRYLEKKPIGEIVLSTDAPATVLEYAARSNIQGSAIYFLDIQLNHEMDGMMLGNELRKIDLDSEIIFITSFEDYVTKVFEYKMKALDYIGKDDMTEARIISCLDKISDREHQDVSHEPNAYFSVANYRNSYNNIIAFEGSRDHKVKVVDVTADEGYDIQMSLKNVESLVTPPFFRIHKSFIVNYDHIKRHYRQGQTLMVEMSNGMTYSVSRKYSKEVLNRGKSHD